MCKKGDENHNKDRIIATDPQFYTVMCFECGEKWIKYRESKKIIKVKKDETFIKKMLSRGGIK